MDWRNIPSLSALRAFEATARLLSFSAAARELNVTHAAIAQHVRGLEAEFSEALVHRQGRGLILTPAGLALATQLRKGFSQIAEGIDMLRAHQEQRPLMITVTPAFAANWLMPRIGAFWAAHPDIQINISPNNVMIDLAQDGFDMAIRYGDGNWPGVDKEPLTSGAFLVVGHPSLVADRKVSCLGDVADLPWLLEHNMMERRSLVESEGVDLERAKVTLLSTNAMVISGVISGLGITLQPESLVERDIEAGNLVQLCRLSQPGLGYYMVTLPNRTTPALGLFQKWLRSVADT